MAQVGIKVDMRSVVGSIRYDVNVRKKLKNIFIRSVNQTGVKTNIYTDMYSKVKSKVPVDTGALQNSPMTNGTPQAVSIGKDDRLHYALGDISDKGIVFNPYSELVQTEINNKPNTFEDSPTNTDTVYYADKVSTFEPNELFDDRDLLYETVYKYIIEHWDEWEEISID